MPCVPSSQDMGEDAVSKSVRRVTPHSRRGSSDGSILSKRLSSKALLKEEFHD